MRNIDHFHNLMTLDANMKSSDIEARFNQIAKKLFENFAIQKGNTTYLFKEIEFYFYNKNHRDIITHPRVSKPLYWYVNDFAGIDLNFSSSIESTNKFDDKGKIVQKFVLDDSAYFGGILIRQLIEKKSGKVLKGPLACAELFRSYVATGSNMKDDLPILVECDNGNAENIITKSRVNILRSNQIAEKKVDNILYAYSKYPKKEKLYKDFCDFIEKPYDYLR